MPAYMQYLLILALLTDVFTPFLIWKAIIPAESRWISHGVIFLVILLTLLRMAFINRFPKMFWLILASSILWVLIPMGYGQSTLSTVWGWWMMFQYPFLCLYIYLQDWMPKSFFNTLRTFCLSLLTLEVIVQIGQYLTGQKPGDNLAGTFGKNGTGILVIFIMFVISLTLGEWIAARKWKPFLYSMLLGIIASTLGEMKLFPTALILVGGLTFAITVIMKKQVLRVIPVAVVLLAVLAAFFYSYNAYVPGAKSHPIESYFLSPQTLFSYLNNRAAIQRNTGEYYYDINRLYALSYGWDSIRKDPMTLLFGFGLGARGESLTLGTTGVGLQRGDLGTTTGTSLLVMLQELGLVGCALLAGILIWIAFRLIRIIRKTEDPGISALCYGLLLFTICWPLWLFYATVWYLRVPMFLYWASLGLVLSLARQQSVKVEQSI